MRPFDPFFKNPHLATIAGNFWKRPDPSTIAPSREEIYETAPNVQVLSRAHYPAKARAEMVLVHGLEGSSESGYMLSMAHAALSNGIAVHRFNMRGCGGTEALSITSYHAGQTSDVLHLLQERKRQSGLPLFLVGFSLGANVSLKLAGELGESASELLAGVASVCAPIDLSACADALQLPGNRLYQNRFLERLKARIVRRNQQAPEMYTLEHLPKINTIREFDDHYTGPLFGFG